ncbi:hypothetical protein MUK42_02961 [Musa troglodytarum]|uniref:Transcription factor TFIIIC triple barrel domain-containing protein n=1 Tax=Musa troglodytarum TaxID=320322 RepID=A0A9E7JJ78_9LILI|nr:hypothetical protein MUK42_02961 [Musa troglodytarum]
MGLPLLSNCLALTSFDRMPQRGKDRPTRKSNCTHLGSIEPGLDTAKPVLVIGDLKLIGEYQDTVGTCYIFSEGDGAPTVTCSETKPSETNVFKDKQFLDSKQAPSKQVKPIASLHKILKFKLVTEDQNETAEGFAFERHSTWLPNIIDQRVEWNWKESNVGNPAYKYSSHRGHVQRHAAYNRQKKKKKKKKAWFL